MTPLNQSYYNRSTLKVAQDLIGKVLIYKNKAGIITETEAYIGQDDPACHASKGYTPRTSVMFGPAGYSYIYLIYGMYHCLNIVTEQTGYPAAVLFRGIQVYDLKTQISHEHINGPGKLCKYFGLTKEENKQKMFNNKQFFIADVGIKPSYSKTPRIGIKVGTDKLWRFVAK